MKIWKLRVQVTKYRWKRLTTHREKCWIVLGLVLFLFSLASLVGDLPGSPILLGLAVLSLVQPIARWVDESWVNKVALYEVSDNKLTDYAEGLLLPEVMLKEGFEVDAESLTIVSETIDSALREGQDWAFQYPQSADAGLRSRLLSDSFRHHARAALRDYAFRSITEPRNLTNDPKVALASELCLDSNIVELMRTDYFTTLITNDLAKYGIRNREEQEIFSGLTSLFPAVENNIGKKLRFLDLPSSELSNHVGANILGITKDAKLVLWVQSKKAMIEPGKMVPTGSGSCDVDDFIEPSFIESIKRTMQRELSEESSLKNKDPEIPFADLENIWIVGHCRNIKRAGKPEFLGVARLCVDAHELKPDITELVDDGHDRFEEQCLTVEQLRQLCNNIQERPNLDLSVILRANLRALARACLEDPEKASEVLGLPLFQYDQ